MSRSPLHGTTLFGGDSITVGTPPLVRVERGEKITVAEVGRPAAWLHEKIRELEGKGGLENIQNAVILIGTNDLGSLVPVERVARSIQGTWDVLKAHGITLYAATIPPFKGWPTLGADAEKRRQALNDMITSDPRPDRVIRLDVALADPSDPAKLAKSVDSGDHLHPKKEAYAAAIEETSQGAPPFVVVPGPSPRNKPEPLWPWLTIGVAGVLGVVLVARRW